MWRPKLYVYRYPDGGDGTGAGGAAAAGAGAAGAGSGAAGGGSAGAGAGAGAGAAAAGTGSLLGGAAAAAGAGAAAAAAAAADANAWLPEKFRVFDGEGEAKKLNVEASAKKLAAEGYSPLEKRMGEGGAPPDKPEGYKTDAVVAALKAKAGDKAGEVKLPESLVKEFNGWAHNAKLTQTQYDKALESYLGGIQQMVDTAFDNAMAKGREELTKVWGADASDPKSAPMQAAVKAFNTYAPATLRTQEVMDKIGNNPVVMQILANIGKEMGEDKRLHGEGAGGENVQAMMNSPAYWNKKHPDHTATVRKVNEFFAAGGKVQQGAKAAAG
jgi:hypothetical protein